MSDSKQIYDTMCDLAPTDAELVDFETFDSDFKATLAHYNDTEWDIGRGSTTPSYFTCDDNTARADAQFFNRLTLLSYYLPLIALVAAACELVGLSLWLSGPVVVWLLAEAINNVEDTVSHE